MSRHFKITPAALIAAFFLLAGAVRPACVFISSISAHDRSVLCSNEDIGDGENEDSTDNESDSEDDFQKIITKGINIQASYDVIKLSYAAWQKIFKEHQPSVITPPPRG